MEPRDSASREEGEEKRKTVSEACISLGAMEVAVQNIPGLYTMTKERFRVTWKFRFCKEIFF